MQRTVESYIIANGKSGDYFFSDKKDRHLTAISSKHGRKIRTERFIAVTSGFDKMVAFKITKVTLL